MSIYEDGRLVHPNGERNDSLELVEGRGWPDTNPCSRCGSRLSDYANEMAHRRVCRGGERERKKDRERKRGGGSSWWIADGGKR